MVGLEPSSSKKSNRRELPPRRPKNLHNQSAFIVSRFQFQVPVPLAVESVFCCVKSALILVKLIENESFGIPPPPLQLICDTIALSIT